MHLAFKRSGAVGSKEMAWWCAWEGQMERVGVLPSEPGSKGFERVEGPTSQDFGGKFAKNAADICQAFCLWYIYCSDDVPFSNI